MAEQKYPHLFSPLTVRGKTFKNRILLAPMGVRETGEPGVMSQTTIDYYERIARGGAARILSAENDVEYGSAVSGHYWYFVDDPPAALLENTRKYAEMCHKYGALAFIHFGYMGAYGRSEETMKGRCLPGMDPEQSRKVLEAARPHHADGSPYLMPQVGGPSDMVIHEPWDGVTSGKLNMDSSDGKVVHALTRQRMEEIADAFAHCAAVVKSCGCDGMVIHSGHGFIFGQWVSRRFNKRTDEFGGSAENRARFPLMCLQRIRDAVGEDFLVEMRFSAQEALEPITDKRFVEDAVDLEDSVAFFRELDKHPGLLDIAHISGGLHTQPVYNTRVTANSLFPMGLNVESAAAIKAAVKNIRVGVVGSMSDPQLCEDVIASGKADFVILCRQLLFADPDFPVKAEAGRDFAIDNCLRCTICRGNDYCTVNPFDSILDPEHAEIHPAARPGKVVVVGGGIGGMKAAEYARRAGHGVVLFEQRDRLGGLLTYTDNDRFKTDIRRFYRNMARRMGELGVDVRLNTRATPALVKAEAPDAVIVAVGGRPAALPVPAEAGANCLDALSIYSAPEKLRGRIAIIGGGLTGCEAAIYLADLGREVTLISRSSELMRKVQPRSPADGSADTHLIWLDKLSDRVEQRLGYACTAITARGVQVMNTATGESLLLPADTVVNASGMEADPLTAESFAGCAERVIPIGDCVRATLIGDAVLAARRAVEALG